MMRLLLFVALVGLSSWATGLRMSATTQQTAKQGITAAIVAAFFAASSSPAFAGIDPSLLQQYVKPEDKAAYTKQFLQAPSSDAKKITMDDIKKLNEAQSAILQDSADIPYTDLASGISYREFREGKGSKVVTPGSTVTVELTSRAKKLATAKELGGVLYYSSKTDTPNNALRWQVGNGEMVPGLEEAMLDGGGMKRGAVRRVEVPSRAIFAARKAGVLPEPLARNEEEARRYKSLFKTEATTIFEVLVDKIESPP